MPVWCCRCSLAGHFRTYSGAETEGQLLNSFVQYFGDSLGRKIKRMPLIEETVLPGDSLLTLPVVIIDIFETPCKPMFSTGSLLSLKSLERDLKLFDNVVEEYGNNCHSLCPSMYERTLYWFNNFFAIPVLGRNRYIPSGLNNFMLKLLSLEHVLC